MTSLLWHVVSEKEKEEIREQAKAIMDGFSRKLAKVDEKIKEPLIERENFEREEGGKILELDREIMFENAPNRNKDFIVGEKGGWGG